MIQKTNKREKGAKLYSKNFRECTLFIEKKENLIFIFFTNWHDFLFNCAKKKLQSKKSAWSINLKKEKIFC